VEIVPIDHVVDVSSYVADGSCSIDIADHYPIVCRVEIQLSFELRVVHPVGYIVDTESQIHFSKLFVGESAGYNVAFFVQSERYAWY
jgi:hypothetical protein